MNTQKKIKHHEKCIQVLEAIEEMKRRLRSTQETKAAYLMSFPDLAEKYTYRVEIQKRAVVRLISKYLKLQHNDTF